MNIWRKIRHPSHWVAGFIIPTSYLLSSGLPFALAFLFVAYEVTQGWRKKDMAYLDIYEATVGAFIGTGVLLIWRLVF